MKKLLTTFFLLLSLTTLKGQQVIHYTGKLTAQKTKIFETREHNAVVKKKIVVFDQKEYRLKSNSILRENKPVAELKGNSIIIHGKVYTARYDKRYAQWNYILDTLTVMTVQYEEENDDPEFHEFTITADSTNADIEILTVLALRKEGRELEPNFSIVAGIIVGIVVTAISVGARGI